MAGELQQLLTTISLQLKAVVMDQRIKYISSMGPEEIVSYEHISHPSMLG